MEELQELGLFEVEYDDRSGFVTATLLANVKKDIPVIGFIAHMDTADFPSENIQPKLHSDYDGEDILLHQDLRITLSPRQFPI